MSSENKVKTTEKCYSEIVQSGKDYRAKQHNAETIKHSRRFAMSYTQAMVRANVAKMGRNVADTQILRSDNGKYVVVVFYRDGQTRTIR